MAKIRGFNKRRKFVLVETFPSGMNVRHPLDCNPLPPTGAGVTTQWLMHGY